MPRAGDPDETAGQDQRTEATHGESPNSEGSTQDYSAEGPGTAQEAPHATGETARASADEGRTWVACPERLPLPASSPSTATPLTFGGVVIDERDVPISNARVTVYSRAHAREGRSSCFAMEAEGTTDARGRFEVTTSPLDWPYYYPRWIEVQRGDLFGTQRWEADESNANFRITARPTQPIVIEVRCDRATAFRVPAVGRLLPSGPDLTVYSSGGGRTGRSVPLPPRPGEPHSFGSEVRLRTGSNRLVFSGACGVHTATVRVQRGAAPPPLTISLPQPDAGTLELTFEEDHIDRVHLYAEDLYVDTIVRDDADSLRLEGVSPGTYRLLRHQNTRDRGCVHEVVIAPGQTVPLALRFARCQTPFRNDVR